MLLLDPSRYFAAHMVNAQALSGSQDGLWLINATELLSQQGGKLGKGQTLRGITVSMVSAATLTTSAANASLVKTDLAHRVYAVPYANTPPVVGILPVNSSDALLDTVSGSLKAATLGEAWTGVLAAEDLMDNILLGRYCKLRVA